MQEEPINLFQRLAGIGTMLVGAFALYYCLTFFGALWDTPQRSIAIGVTVSSALVIFIGLVIGVPEMLPSKIAAMSIFMLGILSMLIGLAILVWFAYNILVAWQKEFRLGSPSIAVAMITVGYALAARSFAKLKD